MPDFYRQALHNSPQHQKARIVFQQGSYSPEFLPATSLCSLRVYSPVQRCWRPRFCLPPEKRAATLIRENANTIIEGCSQAIDRNPQFARIDLPRTARIDHLPGVLEQLANRLEIPNLNDKHEMESAWDHGKMRRQQGYSVLMIVEEARILYSVIAETLHANLLD